MPLPLLETKKHQEEEQYKQVCATCPQVLTEDMSIHIWDNNKNGEAWEEMTICTCCHQDLEDELHAKGWTHDEEEDEDE